MHFELLMRGAEIESISEKGLTYLDGEKYKIVFVHSKYPNVEYYKE